MAVRYEASISLGNVLTLIVLLVSLAGAFVNLSARISVIETKIMPLWDGYTEQPRNFYQKGKP